MTQPNTPQRFRALRRVLPPLLGAALVLAPAACQVPPAQPDDGPGSRGKVLTGQLVRDSAVHTAAHPLWTASEVVHDTATGLVGAGRELFWKRLYLCLTQAPPPVAEDRNVLDPDCLEAELHELTGSGLQPAQVHFDLDGAEALRDLEALLDGATARIDVLIYQWDSDALGWALARRLAARAASLCDEHGPAVRVLVDGGGNLIFGPPEDRTAAQVNAAVTWLAKQPNVEVLRTRNGLARFDHRKLVVVDGRVAWSGGRNFTISSFFDYHDVSYLLRGPLVDDMAGRFEAAWRDAGGPARATSGPGGPGLPADCNAWARVVGTGAREHALAACLCRAIDHAWHHVYLENPYFTEGQLWCRLVKARRRGADVRVVLARDSQSKVIDMALRVTVNRLLKEGIRVYVHPGAIHSKAASVDGRWAYVGTGNFDSLSLRRNNEVGLAVGGGPLIAELEHRLFEADFRPEWEVKETMPTTVSDYLAELLANMFL